MGEKGLNPETQAQKKQGSTVIPYNTCAPFLLGCHVGVDLLATLIDNKFSCNRGCYCNGRGPSRRIVGVVGSIMSIMAEGMQSRAPESMRRGMSDL